MELTLCDITSIQKQTIDFLFSWQDSWFARSLVLCPRSLLRRQKNLAAVALCNLGNLRMMFRRQNWALSLVSWSPLALISFSDMIMSVSDNG
jgi:hypothetical protein